MDTDSSCVAFDRTASFSVYDRKISLVVVVVFVVIGQVGGRLDGRHGARWPGCTDALRRCLMINTRFSPWDSSKRIYRTRSRRVRLAAPAAAAGICSQRTC